MLWFLPSQPTGQDPVGEPSTGSGATHRRKNTNAWITGREPHQNAGTNANATLIYSLKQADQGTHTHKPSAEAERTRTQPTRTVMGGPVPSGSRSWNRGLWWPLPRIKGHSSTGRDIWPIEFWVSRDLQVPLNPKGLRPNTFQFSDGSPWGITSLTEILSRLRVPPRMGKLPKASRPLQGAQIEGTCTPFVCVRPLRKA